MPSTPLTHPPPIPAPLGWYALHSPHSPSTHPGPAGLVCPPLPSLTLHPSQPRWAGMPSTPLTHPPPCHVTQLVISHSVVHSFMTQSLTHSPDGHCPAALAKCPRHGLSALALFTYTLYKTARWLGEVSTWPHGDCNVLTSYVLPGVYWGILGYTGISWLALR